MNIDDMKLRDIKNIVAMFGGSALGKSSGTGTLSAMVGKKVIIRTYSAGVWFGELSEKSGNEVIISNARRMYQWWAAESVSLSACATHGIKRDKSKICEAVDTVWLEAIEIIPCTEVAIDSIGGAQNAKAE